MKIDLDKVGKLTSFVDRLIQLKGIENSLDDDIIEEQIKCAVMVSGVSYTPEEIDSAKKDITWRYQIFATPGQSILEDYDQDNWYDDAKAEIVPTFWTRYKNYLIDEKHFSPNIVSTLGEETLDGKLMNYILDPNVQYPHPVMRKGLIIGDVQSGKTSTYIGFICKAADAGYKVFILLTGTIESLRKQTQERVEEGFVGIDMSANTTGGKRVGVGLDNKPIQAMALTSRKKDFTGDSNKIAVALSDKNAVVFVIKKQKNVLEKLKDWLVTLNADPSTGLIDMPMLLIDDEADNASINTSKSKEDPTVINKLIRELASVFTKSNYVGFTATPFANVFIDPETNEDMETQDLFPEDFIVALPTNSNYIGPNRIFADEGEFHSQLVYINDAGREEEDGFPFYFKHKKDWEDELPESLTDAIYTFYLANAIRDLRGDINQHRSMLVNMSRFIKVQKYIKSQIEEIHSAAYSSIKYNLSSNFDESMKDPILSRIYSLWKKHYSKCEFDWDEIASTLFASIENIQIKIVNSSRQSERLEYPQNEGLRVIAIGGLALSRGLTLEGLIISYFYRNTCTYDVLMQMGRWFGYRKGYEDLFRIWTHKASAKWYAEISDATDKLKADMELMREYKAKPKDFGIRVRNNSSELSITARNKMRNSTDEYEFSSYFGGMLETPYLKYSPRTQKRNFNIVNSFISALVDDGYDFERQDTDVVKSRYIIQGIPKIKIIELLKQLEFSKFNPNFDAKQIIDFLDSTSDPSISKFDIAFLEGANTSNSKSKINVAGREITKVLRHCTIDSSAERINIGKRGKLGGPNDGLAGITDFGGESASSIIEKAKELYRIEYKEKNHIEFTKDKTYPSNTWFKYIEKRRPILLIYLIDIIIEEDDRTQEKQIDKFMLDMNGIPSVGFALGLPRNDNAPQISSTKYKANKTYNWFEQADILDEGDEE